MNNESLREELLNALGELSRARPQWRLGQTVVNIALSAGRMNDGGVRDMEDEEALAAIREMLSQFAEAEAAEPVVSHS